MRKSDMMFNRPIPGQSLTAPPGGMPYEQPPQYATEDEAMYYVLERLSDPDVAPAIKHGMDKGMYASDITNGLLLKGFSQGKFTADVAGLIAKKTLAATVATAMAQGADIKDMKIKRPSKKQQKLAELLASDDPASNELTGGSILKETPLGEEPYDPHNDPMSTEGKPPTPVPLEEQGINPNAVSGKVEYEGPAKGVLSDEY